MGADSEPTLIEIRKEMCRLMERNFEGRSLPPTTIDTFLARAFQTGVESVKASIKGEFPMKWTEADNPVGAKVAREDMGKLSRQTNIAAMAGIAQC